MSKIISETLVPDKRKKRSYFSVIIKRLFRTRSAVMGMIILGCILIITMIAMIYTPYSVTEMDMTNKLSAPSLKHLFGTDELGRDILSRVIYGARYSLLIGLSSTALSAVIGIFFGALAGYLGGWVDNVIMRVFDIFQAIPYLLLCILISAVLGAGIGNCILALGFSAVPVYARILRAQILTVRKMEYVEAAITTNSSMFQIVTKEIIPNAMEPLLVQATMGVAQQILGAASLAYIGLGVQPPSPEWGAMLTSGVNYIRIAPYLVTFPGLMIMFTVLALNLIGDGLRDALDPKMKH